MKNIFGIYGKKTFTYEEAGQLLPIIYRLTEEASREVRKFTKHIEALPNKKSDRAREIEANINCLVEKWQFKLEKLGVIPKGLWLADFDNGEGYFCWKYPEIKISFWHGYHDGFSGRKPIKDLELAEFGLGDHPSI